MAAAAPADGYSVENAQAFDWASVSGVLEPERKALLDECVVGPRVLDAGCGGGGWVDYLTGRGFDAVGVDNHPQFLELATQAGRRGSFLTADLTAGLPFPDRSFDTTVCFDVLEHLDDVAAIRELARVTDRRLILAVPQEAGWLLRHKLVFPTYRDPTHLRYYTEASLRDLVDRVRPLAVRVVGQQTASVRQLARESLRPRGRTAWLTAVYRKAFDFLMMRCDDRLLHMNFAAVVDLRPSAG
jgi:SAM-dependent methyltransferase